MKGGNTMQEKKTLYLAGKINVFPATHADGNTCKYCGGGLKAIGYAKKTEGSRNAEK